ncbi:MAG: hypothetical protein KDA58_01820 [Planctomycetaceae bacterium]|nr:hypothetical protein [Planctomycetaceae bacterium]
MLDLATTIDSDSQPDTPARPEWRQQLVDAESGFRLGLRADSTFFVDFFVASGIVMAACILGISWMAWALLLLTGGVTVCIQLMRLGVRALVRLLDLPREDRESLLSLTTAVVLTMNTIAIVTTALVFAAHLTV